MKNKIGKFTRLLLVIPLVLAFLAASPVLAEEEQEPGTTAQEADSGFLMFAAAASATALQPVITATGYIYLSLDGLGVGDNTPGTIQVDKPAGATVRAAYLIASDVWGSNGGPLPDGAITLNGNPVQWSIQVQGGPNHAWADVTSIVKPIVDAAPAGLVNITVVETIYLDGSILAVIFDDPGQTDVNTVILLFGAQQSTGDTFNVLLADPVDLSNPNLGMELSLGISFGYQDYGSQYSEVDVNGTRLTSFAGGEDDGFGGNGGLITVGGIGDSIANPPDPYGTSYDYRYDDELYNILPFVSDGDTSIVIDTLNPSQDDSIHFAALFIQSAIAIIGEGIVLTPAAATNVISTNHTVTATVQDDDGNPVSGKEVTFTITSGPHAGYGDTDTTDAAGKASYTYTGSTAGTDTIVASFLDSQGYTKLSNEVNKTWLETGENTPPVAVNDVTSTYVNTAVTIDVLTNDSDPDGDALTVTNATDPANGQVVVNADNTITYTPDPDFNGSDSFSYSISDGNGGTDSANVYISIYESVGPTQTAGSSVTIQTGGGTDPVVKCKWEQDTTASLEDGDPTHIEYSPDVTANAQFLPPLTKGGKKMIRYFAVVTDAEDGGNVDQVYADVYHPKDSPPPYSTSDDPRGAYFKYEIPFSSLAGDYTAEEKAAEIDFLNDAYNAHLIKFQSGYDIDDIRYELEKGTASLWMGQKEIDYEQPAGDYTVNAYAIDQTSNISEVLVNFFNYVPVAGVEVDFSSVNYGSVRLGVEKMVTGDTVWDTPLDAAPSPNPATVRNIGNTWAHVTIYQTDMGFGKDGNGNWNVMFDARMGSDDINKVSFAPNTTVTLPNYLQLSSQDEIDLSIVVIKGTSGATYTGTLTIGAEIEPFTSIPQ